MPLIDDIGTVPFAAKKGISQISNNPLLGSTFAGDTIDALTLLLISCGWQLEDNLYATGLIAYPIGFPTYTGTSSGNVGCGGPWVQIYTTTKVWNFCTYLNGQSPVGDTTQCIQFELGASNAASLGNLAAAIGSTSTPWNAVYNVSTFNIEITAKKPGPEANYAHILADGRFGISPGPITGGGYLLSSEGASPYLLKITGALQGGNLVMQFDFTLGPAGHAGIVSYILYSGESISLGVLTHGGGTSFLMVADPYGFAILDHVSVVNNSLAAFSPNIATAEGFETVYAACVVGPGVLTPQLLWGGGGSGQPASVSLGAAPINLADTLRGPQVLCPRPGPGVPAIALNGQPLVTAAYLMMAASYSGAPYVVGKLWDCVVLSSYVPVGSSYQTGGRDYVCIASQAGAGGVAVASLLFCVNDNGLPNAGASGSGGVTGTGGSGPGGGSSPTYPSAPPGSGNGSLSGKAICDGSPDYKTVIWSSGDEFTSDMIGQTLTVTLPGLAHPWVSAGGGNDASGTIPIVASIISSQELKTTEDLNSSFDGAPYTSP